MSYDQGLLLASFLGERCIVAAFGLKFWERVYKRKNGYSVLSQIEAYGYISQRKRLKSLGKLVALPDLKKNSEVVQPTLQ